VAAGYPVRMPDAIVMNGDVKRAVSRKSELHALAGPSDLLAWNLFITHVPSTVWSADGLQRLLFKVQVELVSSRWRAISICTSPPRRRTARCVISTGALPARLLTYALCPTLRATVWQKAAARTECCSSSCAISSGASSAPGLVPEHAPAYGLPFAGLCGCRR